MKPILIIGAGPAGLEAARGVADLGHQAILIEKLDGVGGAPISQSYAQFLPEGTDAEAAMQEMIDTVTENDLIDVRSGTVVAAAQGEAPDLTITLQGPKDQEKISIVSVIVATGFQHFDPGRETQMYGYYEFDDVITLIDAEKMLKAHKFVRPSTGKPPQKVCFIQCVGSRDRQIGNKWCSKVCCGVACQEAIEIRDQLPDCQVFIFYIDMRVYGFWEDEVYWKAQEEKKVNFVRGIATEVTLRGDQVVIKGEDTTLGRPVEVPMDMVILSVGMEPSEGTKEMAGIFNLPFESHGWIETIGGSLNTVATSRPGIFVAGAAAGPADLADSISMGGAAAMKAVAFNRKTVLQTT